MQISSYVKSLFILVSAALVSSCSDSTLQESGGGAGDALGNPEAVALILPFTGFYDLQDNWNGQAGDEAFLSIGEPDIDGVAQATLFDIDDLDNCVPRAVTGEVLIDSFTDQIFMNDILDLNESVLSITNGGLTITLADEIDRDGDGNTSELVALTADRVGMTEFDLVPSC